MALSAEQQANAKAITDVGIQMGLDAQTIAAAIATALMESGLRNLTGGDRDSVGLFQQRPSQGWGTPAQINDPRYAARKFFEAYARSSGGTVLERIANTQRPAAQYRGHYARHFGQAEQILSSITGQPTPTLTGARPSGAQATGTVSAANSGGAVVADLDDLPPDSTPEQIEAWIRKNMPMAAPFLANAEIRAILVRPDIDELGDLEVEQLLRSTTYWQTHGPESRAFDRLIGTDIQAATQAIDVAKNTLGDLFAKNGLQATEEQIGEAAKKAIRAGWMNLQGQTVNPAAINDFLVFALGNQTGEGQVAAGEVAYTADTLGAIAREYLVPLTRRQLDQWALELTAGKQSEESFRSWMTGLAKARFGSDPDLSGAIERGISPGQFFQGHIATVAQILEMDEQQIDLMDPRWMPLIETVDGGSRRAPTLGEVAQWARNQDAYRTTRAYKSTEAELGMQLARSMGALA